MLRTVRQRTAQQWIITLSCVHLSSVHLSSVASPRELNEQVPDFNYHATDSRQHS